MLVRNVVSGGFEGGVGIAFSFSEKIDEPAFSLLIGDVCCVCHGGQHGQKGNREGGDLGSEDVRSHGNDVSGGA